MHVKAFKCPSDFTNKRVMVVGFGNSAADTSTQLVGHASKIYLSHRHGARILPRIVDGAPVDHTHSLRLFGIQSLIMKYFPLFGERMFDKFVKKLQDKSFNLKEEWGFEPAQKVPMVSDTLVDHLHANSIQSVKGIRRILNNSTVELDDDQQLAVDALIFCTGYKSDFTILSPSFDPSAPPTSAWSTARGSNNKPLFNLYLNVFSAIKPDSLAFLGNVHFALGGFHIFDMASMAIAQVFKDAALLPPQSQIDLEIEKHHLWLAGLASRGYNVSPGNVDAGPWMSAMNKLGGTGVEEYLGYGVKGWWFWVRNMKWCNVLVGGIWSPCIYRVFDTEGKREKWDGAREAVERVNAQVKERVKMYKEKAKVA
jgi:dimethylaniline monooxygenase (N-oxide forming)